MATTRPARTSTPSQIEQYGYEPNYQDARAIGSYFGAGSWSPMTATTAQIPDPWREAWKWHYENVWTDHVMMDEALRDAPEFGNGNPFNAGRRRDGALAHRGTSCCASPVDDEGNPIDPDWDIAVVPSNGGVTTSNFNADTFRIWGETEHPEEAFTVLTYLLGDASEDLLGIYGGLPARTADQDAVLRRSRRAVDAGRQLAGRPRRHSSSPTTRASRPGCRTTRRPSPRSSRWANTLRTDDTSTSTRPSTTSRKSCRRSSTRSRRTRLGQ